jgi:hypothetical protein
MEQKKSSSKGIILKIAIVVITLLVLVVIGFIIAYFVDKNKNQAQMIIMEKLFTDDNLYLRVDTSGSESQMLATFSAVPDKQNGSEFIIDVKANKFLWVQRTSTTNPYQYKLYNLSVTEPNSFIFADEKSTRLSFNPLKLVPVVDTYFIKSSDEFKCLTTNYFMCRTTEDNNCQCISVKREVSTTI